MLKAVLWDLDGTLVDSEPAHAVSFDAALAELGLAVGPDFHARCLGASEDAVHAALVAETGTTIERAAWRAIKWRHYQREAARIVPLPGLTALLPALAAAGLPMAVVSNSTRDEVDINLEASGLGGHFGFTVSRDDISRGKPDPEGYLAAAARFGIAPEACVVVEDSQTGATAGVAAGMVTVFHPQSPDLAAPAGAIYAAPGGLGATFARLGLPVANRTGAQ